MNIFAKWIIQAPGKYETDFKTGNKKNLVQSDKKDKKTTETSKKIAKKEK